MDKREQTRAWRYRNDPKGVLVSVLATETHEGCAVHVIEAVPHEDAAVVWSKEILRIRDDDVLLSEAFYDQEGVLVKTMTALEVGVTGGRPMPIRRDGNNDPVPGPGRERNPCA